MPYVQALPTWLALNNANYTSPSGLVDPATGQPVYAGGLNVGDYFDIANDQAATSSYTTNGLLYEGRYRFVQLDSGATASNVKTGTVGYLRTGSSMKSVVIVTAGSGQTAGSYNVQANPSSGGGTGATINVVVGAGGTITSASVLTGGFGYVAIPTFTLGLAILGGTPGTVAAQLNYSVNVVTSADQATLQGSGAIRPVIFLNAATPGNYTFVQELGIATVLGKTGISGSAGDYVNAIITDNGVVTATAASGSPVGTTIGRAIDTPQGVNTFKVMLTGPVLQG